MLVVRDASLSFKGVRALNAISIDIAAGELLGIIGPNGSGKSTLFNVMTGIYGLDAGAIEFEGQPIHGARPADIARCGIARTFQNKRLFGSMTVRENVLVAALKERHGSMLGDILGLAGSRAGQAQAGALVERCLAATGLEDRHGVLARDLPYGGQNRLELARALALEPKLLLLDEPAAGLNPAERLEVRNLIASIHAQGMTVAVVEHDVRMVVDMCSRVVVLDHGEKIADGAPRSVVRDPRVQEAYFGVGEAVDASAG